MIGVIITFYNNEPYIKRCLDSVLEQSYKDFHLFLVDDGSPDDCGRICDEYKNNYANIDVIHQTNQGLSAARNSGIDAAMQNDEIEWVTFIDGDDWVHHDYLYILYHACIDNSVGIAISGMLKTELSSVQDLPFDGRLFISPPDNLCNYEYYDVPYSAAAGKLYSKRVLGDIRFPKGKIHEDEYTNWKWLFSVDRIACVNFPLYYYYVNINGIMNSKWSIRRIDMLPAIREQLEFYKNNHYYNMYNRYLKDYYSGICLLFENLNEDKNCVKLLRKDLRLFLKDFSDDLPYKRREWLYQLLQPKRERIKSMIKAFVNTISNEGLSATIKKSIHFIKRR